MTTGDTMTLPAEPDVTAPDGSRVRVLLALPSGSMAHFELLPGQVSAAVRHRTVAEVWYILSGKGQMWRAAGGSESTVPLRSGTCLTIPPGTSFQFRCTGDTPLAAVAVTMPPWPAQGDADVVHGPWAPYRPPAGDAPAATIC